MIQEGLSNLFLARSHLTNASVNLVSLNYVTIHITANVIKLSKEYYPLI